MSPNTPASPDPEAFPFAEMDSAEVHWVNEPDSEAPTFPEGAWSDHTAEVAEVLRPGLRYQVRYEGTYWNAIAGELGATFQAGDLVALLGRQGNELIIGPLPPTAAP